MKKKAMQVLLIMVMVCSFVLAGSAADDDSGVPTLHLGARRFQ